MKTLLLSLFCALLLAGTTHAQFKVIEHGQVTFEGSDIILSGGGTEDLSESTIMVQAANLDGDNEHAVWVINESDATYTSRVIRTELDVPAGTKNNVCWGICPANAMTAGDMPVWVVGEGFSSFTETLAPGDTAITFAFHHQPQGVDGCSHYKVDIVNDANYEEVLTTFYMSFDHSANSACVTSLEDISTNLELNLAPNPAKEYIDLTMNGVDIPVNIVISDLLGQQVTSRTLFPMEKPVERIYTAEMRNGVYFLSVLAEGQVIRTSKFIVSH